MCVQLLHRAQNCGIMPQLNGGRRSIHKILDIEPISGKPIQICSHKKNTRHSYYENNRMHIFILRRIFFNGYPYIYGYCCGTYVVDRRHDTQHGVEFSYGGNSKTKYDLGSQKTFSDIMSFFLSLSLNHNLLPILCFRSKQICARNFYFS